MGAWRRPSLVEQTVAHPERQSRRIITGEVLTRDAAEWLAERLARDDGLTHAEKALIAYLRENALEIDPRFNEWLTRELSAT